MQKMRKIYYALGACVAVAAGALYCVLGEMRIPCCWLPSCAKTFVATYFPTAGCVSAARVRDAGQPTYEVLLDNGAHLCFDAQGRWTRVECRYSPVPAGIVPEPISGDLAGRYPDAVVCKIAWEYGGYELSIGNGLDLIYAADGTFICEERP